MHFIIAINILILLLCSLLHLVLRLFLFKILIYPILITLLQFQMTDSTIISSDLDIANMREFSPLFVMDRKLDHKYTVWCHNQNAARNTSSDGTHNEPTRKNINTSAWYYVSSFTTVNQYWACIKALINRPRMVSNGMIFIMRDDIHPDWANTDNISGGRISWKLEKSEAESCWENLCCLFVSGEFESTFGKYETRGISISPKKASNIIKLWLGKVMSDDDVNDVKLPDQCIFKDKLMIFRSNADSAALVSTNYAKNDVKNTSYRSRHSSTGSNSDSVASISDLISKSHTSRTNDDDNTNSTNDTISRFPRLGSNRKWLSTRQQTSVRVNTSNIPDNVSMTTGRISETLTM